MEEILNKFNLIKNYKITKINNLQITNPKYNVKYNKIYIDNINEIPEWTNIHKILTKNDYIIDKNIENKIFRLSKEDDKNYINYEFIQNMQLEININKLIIGNLDTGNIISKKDLILNLDNIFEYSSLSSASIFSILVPSI